MKVLAIGDIHAPFNHVNYWKFIRDLIIDHQPDRVVYIGDLVDNHALSFHSVDPDGYSPGHEMKAAIRELQKFYELTPNATWIIGNHDNRLYRKAFDFGIPTAMLRTLKEIYQCPEGWNIVIGEEIDGVLYQHEPSNGGMSNCLTSDLAIGQSIVFGHLHSISAVKYNQTFNKLTFSCATGCGIDDETYAFAYGKKSAKRSVLSAAIIEDGLIATVYPMAGKRIYSRKRRSI